MATFQQGASDQFGPMELHRPDYSFLTQVYGTRQAEYDRGFQMVKSMHDTLLGSQLTNQENESFRQQAFQKIQKQISDISGMDLSKSNMVGSALKVFDPITKDKELAYDMAMTRHYGSQRKMMEGYKNSTDPDKRKLYHQDAEEYLNFGQSVLRDAKRGSGEMFQTPAREFVIFEDVQGYLNKAAKDQGLKIVSETTENGYIKKVTNGAGAVQPFEEWASQQMGTRFDRQFQVSASVNTDKAVMSIMQNQGGDKAGARLSLASQLHPQMMERIAERGVLLETQTKDIQNKLDFIESKTPNYENIPEIKAIVDNLTQNKKSYEMAIEDMRKQSAELAELGPEYIEKNLESIMMSQGKEAFANSWARVNAMKNQEVEMRPDQVVISKWQMENSRQIAQYNQQQANWRHASRLEFDANKFDWERNMDEQKFKLDTFKAESDRIRAEKTGTGSSTSRKDTRSITAVAPYMTPELAEAGYTSVDVYDNARKSTEAELFNSVFGAEKGLLTLVVPGNKYGEVYSSINTLRDFSDGNLPSIPPQEMAVIKEFAKSKNLNVGDSISQQHAKQLINELSMKVISEARDNAEFHISAGNAEAVFGGAEAYNKAMANVQSLVITAGKQEETARLIQERVLDENNNVKESFKGAKVMGFTSSGTAIIDLSNLNREQRRSLESSVGEEYKMLAAPSGMVYQVDQFNNAELFAIGNSNIGQISGTSGGLDKFDLSSINKEDLRDLFGDNYKVSFDPIRKEMIVDLSVVAGSAAKARGLVGGETLQKRIPYSTLNSQASLSEWAGLAKQSSVSNRDFGRFAPLALNPKAVVKASSYEAKTGFDYTVAGGHNSNGDYGLNIHIRGMDPVTKREVVLFNGFTPIADPSDPNVYHQLGLSLDTAYQRYQTGVIQKTTYKEIIPENL